MRLALKLDYCGTHFFGWQIQPEQMSVQQMIQDKIQILCGSPISLTGCGRTDTGVHARNYIAHFDLDETLIDKLKLRSLNALLPDDISIQSIFKVPEEFHARFHAISRKYIYRLQLYKDAFKPDNCFYYRECQSLNFDRLQEAAGLISGLEAFDSFVKTGSDLEQFTCTIFESLWKNPSPKYFEYHIRANRFVRGMVRLIVGMCINLALDKISMQQIRLDLESKRQISKSTSFSAQGLCLESVEYPDELLKQFERLDFRI